MGGHSGRKRAEEKEMNYVRTADIIIVYILSKWWKADDVLLSSNQTALLDTQHIHCHVMFVYAKICYPSRDLMCFIRFSSLAIQNCVNESLHIAYQHTSCTSRFFFYRLRNVIASHGSHIQYKIYFYCKNITLASLSHQHHFRLIDIRNFFFFGLPYIFTCSARGIWRAYVICILNVYIFLSLSYNIHYERNGIRWRKTIVKQP